MSGTVINDHARTVFAFFELAADDDGYVAGWWQTQAAAEAGLSLGQFREGFRRLVHVGAAKAVSTGNGSLPPIWRLLVTAETAWQMIGPVPAAAHGGGPDAAEGERRDRDRTACNRLLVRLIRFHGAHPPDAEAAAAVARLRADFRKIGAMA